jgi:transposase
MQKIPKREFTIEFKQQAIQRVKDGYSTAVVARELGVTAQTLRNWIKAAPTGSLEALKARQ